ncbi:MAG: response regulator [Methylococcales bacterium]|nr:response regulator [Methylococcales bacterium]
MITKKPDSLIYVVDDEFAVRDSLSLLIESTGQAVRSFASAEEFLDGYDPDCPGCLLLDVRMPGVSGLELQELLLNRGISIPIIFISGHAGIPDTAKAFRAGAVDFLEKPFSDGLLLKRVEEAIAIDIANREQREGQDKIQSRLALLTAREHEVMAQIVGGHSNKEVARVMGISNRTVEAHRSSIMEKMQASNLAELIMMVTQAGILEAKPNSGHYPFSGGGG